MPTDDDQAACLDTFRGVNAVAMGCGHVIEVHHNNWALEPKHFEPLRVVPCPWCGLLAAGTITQDEHDESLRQHHIHARFWGETVALRRITNTVEEWQTFADIARETVKEMRDGAEETG